MKKMKFLASIIALSAMLINVIPHYNNHFEIKNDIIINSALDDNYPIKKD